MIESWEQLLLIALWSLWIVVAFYPLVKSVMEWYPEPEEYVYE